jgi:phosphatidylglycerol:prolipoprotein diacylglycerol transferase
MHPDRIEFSFGPFGFGFDPYGAALFFAFVLVCFGSGYVFWRSGVKRHVAGIFLLATGFSALVGARALNGLLNWNLYREESFRWVTADPVGFSLYGGIVAGALAGYFLARAFGLNPWRLADLAAPSIGAGVAMIRVGCFLRGCCFGTVTDMPWGVTFPLFSQAHLLQLHSGQAGLLSPHSVHPTQLYELSGAVLSALLAWVLVRKRRFPDGVAALLSAIVFTLVRLVTFFFREMPGSYVTPTYFYPILYLVLLSVLVFLLRSRLRASRAGE